MVLMDRSQSVSIFFLVFLFHVKVHYYISHFPMFISIFTKITIWLVVIMIMRMLSLMHLPTFSIHPIFFKVFLHHYQLKKTLLQMNLMDCVVS